MTDSGNKGNAGKPNLHSRLFWDCRYDEIDWQVSYLSIIARVVERGTGEEMEELTRFYGRDIQWPQIEERLKKAVQYPEKVFGTWQVKALERKKGKSKGLGL